MEWYDLTKKGQRIVQIGCGAVGSCMLPLYDRHMLYKKGDIIVIDMKEDVLIQYIDKYPNIVFVHEKVTQQNYKDVCKKLLSPGDLLLDLAWYIQTLSLLKWCHENEVLFLNTAVETWLTDTCDIYDKQCQTLYSRQLEIKDTIKKWNNSGPTAILTHGANPGWVSHVTKLGIEDWVLELIDKYPNDKNVKQCKKYLEHGDYARAFQCLNVQAIHIAERDTQISNIPKQVGEFVNTWSPEGFIEESMAPAELGWGTHETLKMNVNTYSVGPKNQVYFDSMGMNTLIRSWVPSGDIVGMIVRHEEAFSISHYLTVKEGNKAVYRPTVHYAYYSCPDSIASLYEVQANGYKSLARERVLKKEIISGQDELGIFMLSKDYGCWWIGSLLNNEEANELIPDQSATVIQVASSVLAGIIYAFNHDDLGVIHPEMMDPFEVMQYIIPYLGRFVSFSKEWQPNYVLPQYAKTKDWIIQKLLVNKCEK